MEDKPHKIMRNEAIKLLAQIKLLKLSNNDKEFILYRYFSSEDKFSEDSFEANLDSYLDRDIEFNHIYLKYIENSFIGVKNDYLKMKIIENLNISQLHIEGKMKKLKICPCCRYRTLHEKLLHICSICLWEDDFLEMKDDSSHLSNLNGISLKKAKINFLNIGVFSEDMLDYRNEDNIKKYEKS